jgi:hypothetical protein
MRIRTAVYLTDWGSIAAALVLVLLLAVCAIFQVIP